MTSPPSRISDNTVFEAERTNYQPDESSVPSYRGLGDTSFVEEVTAPITSKPGTSNILEHVANEPTYRDSKEELRLKFLPPLGLSESEFIQGTGDVPSPFYRYIQVLIWCITRQIEVISLPDRKKTLFLRKFLDLLKTKLAEGEIRPRVYSESVTPLKPTIPNPENENLRQVINDLKKYNLELKREIESAAFTEHEIKIDHKEVPNIDLDFVINEFKHELNHHKRVVGTLAEIEGEVNQRIRDSYSAQMMNGVHTTTKVKHDIE